MKPEYEVADRENQYPKVLPVNVVELILALDRTIPAVEINGPISEQMRDTVNWQCARRSVVDELLYLAKSKGAI